MNPTMYGGVGVSLQLAQLIGGWPVVFPLVAAASARSLLAGRRRSALNEALHELRRPLQALALSSPEVGHTQAREVESSLQMVTAAVQRLDREINGGAGTPARESFAVGSLLDAAASRWRRRATLRGGSLQVRCAAGGLLVSGDRGEISQALDNLIDNALEHGGPRVLVTAAPASGGLRITVTDSGAGIDRLPRVQGGALALLARLGGRSRHGHGLRVVRRVAAAHGGSFRLRHTGMGTEAELDLPLLGGER